MAGLNLIQRAGWVLDTIRDHQYVHRMMGIGSKDLVLDVGSGAGPCLRSNVLCDKFVSDATERQGQSVVTDRPFIVADAACLPFADKSFDFVICSHVLEHVPDPGAVIRELQRVAPRGYIETPSAGWEKVNGFRFHLWMVSLRDRTLVFEKKRGVYQDPELRDWFAGLQRVSHFGERLWKARRHIGVYTALCWEESISYEIHDTMGVDGFVHAVVDGDDEEYPESAQSGLASRLLSAWGRRLRRSSEVTWDVLEQRLACPECRGRLRRSSTGYACAQCAYEFPIDAAGHPRLLPRNAISTAV